MTSILHAAVAKLGDDEVDALLEWVASAPGAPGTPLVPLLARCGHAAADEPLWVLAHCDDGVTWGRHDGRQLALSHDRIPRWQTPLPVRSNIQQLRVFGARGELLVWREEDARGHLRGRSLVDVSGSGTPEDDGDAATPLEQEYVIAATAIAADGVAPAAGFTAVTDRTGRVQVVPVDVTANDFAANSGGRHALALGVKHYFARDDETGAVRIAATRLVALRPARDDSFIKDDIST